MAGSANSEDGEMGFQIAPMVDVVFVLMLFFMAIVGMKEYRLDAKLPGPPGVNPVSSVIRIDITEEGVVSANETKCGEPLDRNLPELRAWLTNVLTYGPPDPVLIHPAPGTRQERIIDVLNAVAALDKFKDVAFN